MTRLREAVREYLNMRRSLGFKLQETGRLLLSFVKFLEEYRSSTITTRLALAWAQQPSRVQPAEWAHRLSVVRTFARHRSAAELTSSCIAFHVPFSARSPNLTNEEIRVLV